MAGSARPSLPPPSERGKTFRMSKSEARGPWWREWPLALAVVTLTLALLGKAWIATALGQSTLLVGLLAIICSVILAAAVAIVRHADVLAHRLGEPAGTLLLTLAITGLEVAMVAFVMSTGADKPTLARDTMFAVVMLVLNGFLGLALLLGGLRHHEQRYNLQSANAFLVLILPLTVLGLVLPNFTHGTTGRTLSTFQMIFLLVMSVGIYGVFLFVQNRRHRGFFMAPEKAAEAAAPELAHHSSRSTLYHALMLGFYGLPLVIGVSLATGRALVPGVDAVDAVLLVLTLLTSMLTFSLPRTNVLLGCVHLLLFGAYLMLMFDR
jgi:Ca2+:H+ antiporter